MIFATLTIVSCGKKSADSNPESMQSDAPELPVETAPQTAEENNGDTAPTDPTDWKNNKGIGPVTSVTIAPEIDEAMAKEGEEIFNAKCTACHKPDKKFIGPAPKDILERRTPEWVMNMILNPQEMIQKDPIAKQLLAEANGAPMANQNLTEEQARAVVEYYRTIK